MEAVDLSSRAAGDDRASDQFSAMVAAVTSAFGDPTRREIYLYARNAEAGVTAADVAERFSLHPNVARHHLDKLAAGGYLEVQVGRIEGAGAGRPSKRYRASSRETLDFTGGPSNDLIVTLLARALALLPRDQAEALAEEVGEEHGRALAAAMSPTEGNRSRKAAMQAVADAFTAHGFAAHAEARGNGALAIINDHCPFGVVAADNPVICAVDRGMVKGMLAGLYGETMPETTSSRALGDDACVTVIS
ncbi:MAG TPA: helix-turn-helix domain-containing protein [Acidimicrobiales bacterium]|nr:helix-turn-helix domain-containing protein [Acidimicrobiales bacterium]